MSRWRTEADELLKRSRSEHLKILVWGPGNPGPKAPDAKVTAYNKRIQIRDELRNTFPSAEVYLSEDPEMQAIGTPNMSNIQRETLQALLADLIVILNIGRGTDLELDYFAFHHSWFREKVYVLLPERFLPPRGLAKGVFDRLTPEQIVGFSQREFDTCKVATEKAISIATTVAMQKRMQWP